MGIAGWILIGAIIVTIGFVLPALVTNRSVGAAVSDDDRYSPRLRLLDINAEAGPRISQGMAFSHATLLGGMRVSKRNELVAARAQRAALIATHQAGRVRRGVLLAATLIGVAVTVGLVAATVVSAAWIALPATLAGGAGAWMLAAEARAKQALAAAEERIETIRDEASNSPAAILQRRLAARAAAATPTQVQVAHTQAPAAVETTPVAATPVSGGTAWTPMPVPKPLYSLKPMVQKRDIDAAELVAQFSERDQARAVYRPTRARSFAGARSGAEVAGYAVAPGQAWAGAVESEGVQAEVDQAINRRRAASF